MNNTITKTQEVFRIELVVDAGWLVAIQDLTNVDYLEKGEVLSWAKIEKIKG